MYDGRVLVRIGIPAVQCTDAQIRGGGFHSGKPCEEAALSEHPRCLVVDAQLLVRLGAEHLLSDRFEVEGARTRREAIELIEDVGGIDVALIDAQRSVNGDPPATDAISAMTRAEPSMGVVAVGERPHRHLATAALQAGASAYVTRTTDQEQLLRALEAALDSKSYLDPAVPSRGSRGKITRRQREILQLLADGESTTRAARELDLSEETVKTHMKNIFARLEARNRAHAVAIGLREALID
jgi:DNA-binding NarL/FixJ family response regulator